MASRRQRGLATCALIGAWLAVAAINATVESATQDADSRLSEVEDRTSALASRLDDLADKAGDDALGRSQSSRIDGVEQDVIEVRRRADDLESRMDDAERAERDRALRAY